MDDGVLLHSVRSIALRRLKPATTGTCLAPLRIIHKAVDNFSCRVLTRVIGWFRMVVGGKKWGSSKPLDVRIFFGKAERTPPKESQLLCS